LDLNKQISRGQKAKELLEEPLLQDSLKAIRNKLDTEWKNSPLRDVEGREKIFFLVKAIDELEAMLISEMETGKLASEQLK
jgi:hypothetical protein|tara:strand:+ start:68 stop:310 length:243 start_codon:yes stop_codon:yes gene_type:complete